MGTLTDRWIFQVQRKSNPRRVGNIDGPYEKSPWIDVMDGRKGQCVVCWLLASDCSCSEFRFRCATAEAHTCFFFFFIYIDDDQSSYYYSQFSSSSAPYQTTKTLTMATSMAAAIAASLPAPQAASAPAAPVHEPIPASMSKLIDMEAEISLHSVQLEGLVCPAVVAPHFAWHRLWSHRSFRKSSNTAQNPTRWSTGCFSDWTSTVF